MKLSAKKISKVSRSIVIETELSEYYLNRFMLGIDESKQYEITIKERKENRSVRQNDYLWALVELVSMEINGSKRSEDTWDIYKKLLHRANVKYMLMRVEEVAEPSLMAIEDFRYVERLPHSREDNKGRISHVYKCYLGSSKFNTKEMSELLEAIKDWCGELNIDTSEVGYETN